MRCLVPWPAGAGAFAAGVGLRAFSAPSLVAYFSLSSSFGGIGRSDASPRVRKGR